MELRYSFLQGLKCQLPDDQLPTKYVISGLNVCGQGCIPLNGPVHDSVSGNEGRSNVEDLVSESAEDVEDGSVTGTGKRALTVGGHSVGGDALGGRAS